MSGQSTPTSDGPAPTLATLVQRARPLAHDIVMNGVDLGNRAERITAVHVKKLIGHDGPRHLTDDQVGESSDALDAAYAIGLAVGLLLRSEVFAVSEQQRGGLPAPTSERRGAMTTQRAPDVDEANRQVELELAYIAARAELLREILRACELGGELEHREDLQAVFAPGLALMADDIRRAAMAAYERVPRQPSTGTADTTDDAGGAR
jgi:hypothetical protein